MTNPPDLQSGVTRDIYGMPTFISLAVSDVRAAAVWFTEALDFVELFAMPPGDDPVLIHLSRWRYQDILIRRADTSHQQSAAPVTGGIQVSFAAECDELDGLAERARRHGAAGVTGPGDTAWNTRDLQVTTPQGLCFVFTARRPEPLRDATFVANMDRWNAAQPRLPE